MAATIVYATGYDERRMKETHRLGSMASSAKVATRRTAAQMFINADGSGAVRIVRDGETLHEYRWEAEAR